MKYNTVGKRVENLHITVSEGPMYSNIKTYLILFAGVFALSTSAIFVKIADAPSSVIAFYRLLIAGTVLLPFFLCSRKCRAEFRTIRPRQWRQILSAGLLLALHYVLWFESLNFTSTASSTVIVCLQPLFSLGLERFVSKKKISNLVFRKRKTAVVKYTHGNYNNE